MDKVGTEIKKAFDLKEVQILLLALRYYIEMNRAALYGESDGCCEPLSKSERIECRQMIKSAKAVQEKVISMFSPMGVDSILREILNQ